MSDRIRIAMADDHALMIDSFKSYLSKSLPCEFPITANNGEELVGQMEVIKVDLVLLDVEMPVMDGIEALKIIKSINEDQKVIVLSMYDDEALLLKLLRFHINGFVSKSAGARELTRAILEVHKEGHYYSERLLQVMYNNAAHVRNDKNDGEVYPDVDEIDRKILKMMCDQQTSKEIACKLCMSYRSIEGRRKKLLKLTGARNQAGLILFAIKRGIYKL